MGLTHSPSNRNIALKYSMAKKKMAHGGQVMRPAAMEHEDGGVGQHEGCVGMYSSGGVADALLKRRMAKMAAGGVVEDVSEELGEGHTNSAAMPDDFLSLDSDPMDMDGYDDMDNEMGLGNMALHDEENPKARRRGILISIMNGLGDKHYGRNESERPF